MRVLIIDDSRANRMVLQRILQGFGFETVEAENGGDAIWLLRKDTNIQLITVDYHMPQMTGVQFVRLVREKPEFAKIPILMISVERRPEVQAEALASGVNEFLMKPFSKEMVEEKLMLMGVDLKAGPNQPPAAAQG
ncbi:MAG: response regulator [Verrucomicrobia bacterium]|nr:response regulator [Verrucomicrobiota bacterium]